MWVGIVHSIEGLKGTKGRGRRSSLILLIWNISIFYPQSDWDLYYGLPWFSGFWTPTEWHHQLSWVLACKGQTVTLLSLHNHVNQFLIINLCYERLFCFSGELLLIKAAFYYFIFDIPWQEVCIGNKHLKHFTLVYHVAEQISTFLRANSVGNI